MLIDWFTVVAQALNFLILVWLMKRFLYQPILNAVDAREKKIASELSDADAKRTQAQKDLDDFKHKNDDFDRQRAGLWDKATGDAKAEQQRLMEEARKAADTLNAQRQAAIKAEITNLNQDISRRTRQEVFAISRKALSDLATTSLEERMGDVFTRRLRDMETRSKRVFGEALKQAGEPALLRSTFVLAAEERNTIQNAINETFSADIHIRFETSPDLVSGIELTSNGQKLAWSISDYLTTLEKSVGELLEKRI